MPGPQRPSRPILLCLSLTLVTLLGVPTAHANLSPTEKWPTGPGACIDTPLRLVFPTPVHLGATGKILVTHASDHTVADSFDLAAGNFTDTIGGKTLRIDPILIDGATVLIHLHRHTLRYGETYAVAIDPTVFLDAQNQPFSSLSDKNAWTFSVRSAPAAPLVKRLVAADGTGDFCTVQGAIDDIPLPNPTPTLVFVKAGTYDGLVRIPQTLDHLTLLGQDRKKTILTALDSEKLNPSVSARSVVCAQGNDLLLQNLTLRNRTPWKGTQSETLYLNAERCILRDDDFSSFQDTLCLNGRVYVANCSIEGDVDFIWGFGSVFLDRCEVHALHGGYFVQARNAPTRPGYIFSRCKLTCADETKKCWLGRIDPVAFPASQVAYLHCLMGPGIPPEGWLLDAPKGQPKTTPVLPGPQLQFEEYRTLDLDGKPLDISHRLPGSKQLTDAEAASLSDPAQVLAGPDQWNPLATPPPSN